MPQTGDMAPDFTLPRDGGGSVSLADLRGGVVVLFFYPRDNTPGCTIEAKEFRDHADAFEAANTVIIGVSKDSIKKHCNFIEKFDLNFRLGSDEEGSVCEDYGVWVEKNMYGRKSMGIERSTFLIDAEGKIAEIWRKVKVPGHVEAVLERAKSL